MEGGGRKSTLVSKANAERHARVFSFRSSSDSQVVPPAKLEKREGKRSNCKKKKVRCKKEKKKREEETERKKRSFAGNDLMPSPFPYLKGREGRREGSRGTRAGIGGAKQLPTLPARRGHIFTPRNVGRKATAWGMPTTPRSAHPSKPYPRTNATRARVARERERARGRVFTHGQRDDIEPVATGIRAVHA